MGFIIAYFVKLIIKLHKPHKKAKPLTLLWISFLLLLTIGKLHAYETSRSLINDSFGIELSGQVQEAMDNGIVLNFDCELETNKEFWLLTWPSDKQKHQFSLTHHSLSNRYLVRFNDIQAPKNFKSSGEAIAFITEQSITFFRQYAINSKKAEMRLSLNKFKLPGPMRLNAFISEQWNIDTGWISWSPDI